MTTRACASGSTRNISAVGQSVTKAPELQIKTFSRMESIQITANFAERFRCNAL